MSKRKSHPETGEPYLIWRENKMVDAFVTNAGDNPGPPSTADTIPITPTRPHRTSNRRRPTPVDESPSGPTFLSIYLHF
jgi:hypothetical protein